MNQIILALFITLACYCSAQNDSDLFRYSKTTYYGTARFEAMGGSFGALGADLSSSQINPAGYGRYSSSTFGASFFGGSTVNDCTFQGTETRSSKGQGGLSNIGVVLTEDISENSKGFLYYQLGIGYNQIEKFKNTFKYEGQQFESVLDNFVSQAQGYLPEELNDYFAFSTDLAYNTHSINYDNVSQSYYSLLNSGDMYHTRTVESKGGIGEYYLSLSTNYLNKLYIGANFAIRSIRYDESYLHSESLTDTSNTPLRSFDYEYQFTTKGNGVNLKLGGIYLVNEALRFGLAFHTSTFSELTDNYTANMISYFKDSVASIPEYDVPTGNYKYKLRNPGKVVGSIAYVFGTKGCLNIDVEYLNYKRARFKSTSDPAYTPYTYDYENEIAKEVFQDAFNLRVGGEFVIVPGFFIRGGFGYYGNAYKSDEQVEINPDIILSGGIGIKTKVITIDISYRNRTNTRNYYAFSQSVSKLKTNISNVVLSCSVNF